MSVSATKAKSTEFVVENSPVASVHDQECRAEIRPNEPMRSSARIASIAEGDHISAIKRRST